MFPNTVYCNIDVLCSPGRNAMITVNVVINSELLSSDADKVSVTFCSLKIWFEGKEGREDWFEGKEGKDW